MVERFSVKGWNDDHIQFADPDGKWVHYSDYATLEVQLAELEEENERFRKEMASLSDKYSDLYIRSRTGAVDTLAEVRTTLDTALLSADPYRYIRAALSALEPAAPTSDVSTEGQQEPVAWRDDKGRTLDKRMSMWRKRDEVLDRGSWLGVSEIAGRLVRPKDDVREELRSLAIDGKIEREDFSSGTFWRGVLPSDITRPSETSPTSGEQAVTEAAGPFVTFANHAIEKTDDGWVWRTSGNERICDWFGPSDFGGLKAAMEAGR